MWGCRKGARWGKEDIARVEVGADTDLRVRAMLASSIKVPPGCAVTQASRKLLSENHPGRAMNTDISAIFPFNG